MIFVPQSCILYVLRENVRVTRFQAKVIQLNVLKITSWNHQISPAFLVVL